MNIFGYENYKVRDSNRIHDKLNWSWKPKNWVFIKHPRSLLGFNSKIEVHLGHKFASGFTLLLSRKKPMIGNIITNMKQSKKPFVYINWDEFVEEGVVYFDESQNEYQLRYKKETFNLKNVRSVFLDYSELGEVFHFKRQKFSNKEKVFISRWIEALNTLEFVTKNAAWYPARPSFLKYESQNKFGDALLAKRIGLPIPKMIYTNDSREAQKFLKNHEGIVKESGIKFFEDASGKIKFFESKLIRSNDKNLSKVSFSPCMFQEFIDKQYDIRAVVVEDKVLAAKIESQSDERAKKDWRGREHLVPFKPYKLPVAIQKKLIRFMKDMNYRIANFDLVRGVDGKYYFLEMNRPGQWFFIEVLSGIPVTKTIVNRF